MQIIIFSFSLLCLCACIHDTHEKICLSKIKEEIRKDLSKSNKIVGFKVIGTIPEAYLHDNPPVEALVRFFELDTNHYPNWRKILIDDSLRVEAGKISSKRVHNFFAYQYSDTGEDYDYTISYQKINSRLFFVSVFRYSPNIFNAHDAGQEWAYFFGFDKNQDIVLKTQDGSIF